MQLQVKFGEFSEVVLLQLKQMNPSKMSSALGGALLVVKFGELSVAVQVSVDSRTHEGRSSEIEELPAVMQETRVLLSFSCQVLVNGSWPSGHVVAVRVGSHESLF